MNAAKPPSGAWMVSQLAARALALRNAWGTPGGAATNPPAETMIGLRVAPELEGQFSLEDVEGIGVFVVNVRAGDVFAGCVARVGDRHFLGCDKEADLALPAKDRFPLEGSTVGGGRDRRSSRHRGSSLGRWVRGPG